jgi:hypothetical protein
MRYKVGVTGDDPRGWLGDRLGSARADAARIARELAGRGFLTSDQVAELVTAVDDAIARGHELLAAAVAETQRVLRGLRATSPVQPVPAAAPASDPDGPHGLPAEPGARARIAALEARVAMLEEALEHAGRRARRGSEGD